MINASHAMSEEGGILSIATSISSDNSFVCAEISDTGCGISEGDMKHIFDPFFTTKSEGTGLGLSISYGIVENNNGKIEVKSQLGKGTTFKVLLPVSESLLINEIIS
jgi:signal transduction histidine kinase